MESPQRIPSESTHSDKIEYALQQYDKIYIVHN